MLSTLESTSPVMYVVHRRIPKTIKKKKQNLALARTPHVYLDSAKHNAHPLVPPSCVRFKKMPTPLTRSKISLIATQNSSKSNSPSPSTSARSHTFSSCSSRNRLFLRTVAACALLRCGWPLESEEKISQYRSTSHCSIFFSDML